MNKDNDNNGSNTDKAIQLLRKYDSRKQSDIADKLQVTDSTYNCYETGKIIPGEDSINKILDIFNIPDKDALKAFDEFGKPLKYDQTFLEKYKSDGETNQEQNREK